MFNTELKHIVSKLRRDMYKVEEDIIHNSLKLEDFRKAKNDMQVDIGVLQCEARKIEELASKVQKIEELLESLGFYYHTEQVEEWRSAREEPSKTYTYQSAHNKKECKGKGCKEA